MSTEKHSTQKYQDLAQQQHDQTIAMRAVCSLAQGLVHEFNNLLGTMLGSAEMLKDEVEPDSYAAKDVARILRAGERAKDLVSHIRALYRRQDHDSPPADLGAAIQKTIDALKPELTPGINLHWKCGPGQAMSELTWLEVRQIVLNLIHNSTLAIDPDQGRIDISLEQISQPHELLGLLNNQQSAFVITVRDTGEGMDNDVLERIFEPFFTTRQGPGSSGMGLTTVYALVHEVGGVTTAASAPGHGTTIKVILPPLAAQSDVDQKETPLSPKEEKHILLVDDDTDLLELHERIVINLGYQVTTLSDSQEALKRFRQEPDAYDLLITDQSMPQQSGQELAANICRIRPDMPIILCSGYTHNLSDQEAERCNIRQILCKPLSKIELAEAIKNMLGV